MKKLNDEEVDLEQIKKAVLRKFPALGPDVVNSKFFFTNEVKTAATDGIDFMFNKRFMASLSREEQMFTMAHEIMHKSFRHIPRMSKRDLDTWNKATDAVINQKLVGAGLKMPKGLIDIKHAKDKSSEEMYRIIYEHKQELKQRQQPQSNQSQQQNQPGSQGQSSEQSSQQQGQSGNGQQGGQQQNGQNQQQNGNGQGQSQNQDGQDDKSQQNQGDKSQQSGNGQQSQDGQSGDKQNAQGQNNSGDGKNTEGEKGSQSGDGDFSEEDLDNIQAPSNHDLWEKGLKRMQEEAKKKNEEKNKQSEKSKQDEKSEKGEKSKQNQKSEQDEKDKTDKDNLEKGKDKQQQKPSESDKNEKDQQGDDQFGENFEENFSQINDQLKKELADQIRQQIRESSKKAGLGAGNQKGSFGKLDTTQENYTNWKRILKKELEKETFQWSDRRASKSNDYATRIEYIEDVEKPEIEVILDTSGSIDDNLLRSFLIEVKKLAKDAKMKVGCFDDKFYGFTKIKKMSDIDNYVFEGRGGTNIDKALAAFSKDRKVNKILFTDAYDWGPKRLYDKVNCIWVVFDNESFTLKNRRVIHVDKNKLYRDTDEKDI